MANRKVVRVYLPTRAKFERQLKNSLVARITLQCGADHVTGGLRSQLDNIARNVAEDMLHSFRMTLRK